jgi:hypothetical protein
MSAPSGEREPVQHGVWFPPAPLYTGSGFIVYDSRLRNHHVIQDLDVALPFRHFTSIGIEKERQMGIFWWGE